MDFSEGSTLSCIVCLLQVPSDAGSWWLSSLRWHWAVLAPFFGECVPRYLSFSQFLQVSVDIFPLKGCDLFSPNSTDQDPKLFIFLCGSQTEASVLLLILWVFWQPFLTASLSQRFSALPSPDPAWPYLSLKLWLFGISHAAKEFKSSTEAATFA